MKPRIRLWFFLVTVAAIPRLAGAFFLPNTFGDAYVYIRDIGTLSTKIKSGTFVLADLYGFWLPLYQLMAGVVNVFVGNGFYAGKVVSAIFGVGVCLLVYVITLQVTQHRAAAQLSYLLIALNPLHILNSASAMTDVPHGFFVLASLSFVLKSKWSGAAVFVALAGLTRVESWMLLALIPAIQFWKERRVSVSPPLIMLIAPLFWFYVSWKATGDWLACFRVRQQYHDWLLAQNPALVHFSFSGVLKDVAMLLSGADVAVLIAAFVVVVFVIKRVIKQREHRPNTLNIKSILPALAFFFAFLTLLVAAYLMHQQPIIFPRYGLILFSTGIPILAWTYGAIVRRRPEWSRRLLVAIAVLCLFNASAQFVGGVGELNRYGAQRRAAEYLRAHLDPTSNARIFCDEGTVRALSGIADDRFITSSNVPRDHDGFLSALDTNRVEWLVISKQPGSIPPLLFPWSEHGERIGSYESGMNAKSEFLPVNIHVYRRTQ